MRARARVPTKESDEICPLPEEEEGGKVIRKFLQRAEKRQQSFTANYYAAIFVAATSQVSQSWPEGHRHYKYSPKTRKASLCKL